jgi:hypothetical protein
MKTKNLLLRTTVCSIFLSLFFSNLTYSQARKGFILKLPSLSFQPELAIDTNENDSSLIVDFGQIQIDTIFAKYKVYRFEQACPNCKKQANKEYFIVECDTLQLANDINLYLEETIGPAEMLSSNIQHYYTPNDYYDYGISTPQQYNYLDLVNAKGAWNYTKGNPNIKIGLIDFGILETHEDLANKVELVGPSSYGEHGTLVAGCIAADSDNGKGIAAIGFNCNILYQDQKWNPAEIDLIEMANSGARVINTSWGYCGPTTFGQSIMDELYERGVIIVASAGNGNNGNSCPDANGGRNGYSYPASYDHVISVTGVCSLYDYGTGSGGTKYNWKDVHVFDGNKPTGYKYWTHNDKVDISAPGWTNYTTNYASNTDYISKGGTSLAAPVVSGAIGLLLSINPCFSPDDIEYIIKSTSHYIDGITENQEFAGTLGAGRLDAEAACSLATAWAGDHVISNGQNITWSGYKIVAKKLTIQSGGTLTIQGKVNLGPNAKIVVERGAKLILDGCTLTTGCFDSMWYGIEVWGNPSVDQRTTASHGWLEIKNGTIIEHAKNAIYTGRLDGNMDWVWTHTGGGIVQATGCTFKNNGRSVEIMAFHNPVVSGKEPANVNFFRNCTFETTGYLRENLYVKNGVTCAPTYFVTVWSVKGVRFLGNNFRNTAFATDYAFDANAQERLGGGVLFFGASCIFDNYNTVQNTFSNLYRGIDNWSLNGITSATVNNCVFTNVSFGVTLDGVRGDKISGCTFDTDNNLSSFTSLINHIQTRKSGGYLITENNLKKTVGTVQNSFAINADNTEEMGCEIYKNTFRDVVWGLETNNDNQKLALQCNDFDNLYRDWNSNRLGINGARASQQIYENNVFISPYNLFDQNCSATNKEHIFNATASLTGSKYQITYTHGSETRKPQSSCVTTNNVNLYDWSGPNHLGCASKTPRDNGTVLGSLTAAKTAATQRQALIDGGRTQDLLSLINNPLTLIPALLDTLDLYSPYLSDLVLIATINNPYLSSSDLYTVLWANSGLTPEVFEALDTRDPAMSGELYELLAVYADSVSPRDTIDAQIRALFTAAQLELNELLRNYEDSGLVDSISYQLSLLADVDSKGRYIHTLIEQSNFTAANLQIWALDVQDEAQADLFDFESMHYALRYAGENWFAVTETQREDLHELATHTTPVALFAEAVLILIGDTMLFPVPDTTWEEEGEPFMMARLPQNPQHPKTKESAIAHLLAYPNPFNNDFEVAYHTGNLQGVTELRIYNLQGLLVKEVALGNVPEGNIRINMATCSPGLYLVQLVNNGSILKTQKLLKQR